MIEVKNVTKSFRERVVLDDISFKISEGEFVSLVGKSGSGKTTLINILIGGEKPDTGVVKVQGKHVEKLKGDEIQEFRRRVGVVFQDFRLLENKTVFENVAFALEVAGYSRSYVNEKTVEVLKIVGMEHLRNSLPGELSGGEKQKTAIARALIHAPKLLIADEPTGNLDQENALMIADLLREINKQGTTVLLSTHNAELMNIGERIFRLEAGKMLCT